MFIGTKRTYDQLTFHVGRLYLVYWRRQCWSHFNLHGFWNSTCCYFSLTVGRLAIDFCED